MCTMLIAEALALFGSLPRKLDRFNTADIAIDLPGDLPVLWRVFRIESRGLRLDLGHSRRPDANINRDEFQPQETYSVTDLRAGWPMLALRDRQVVRHGIE